MAVQIIKLEQLKTWLPQAARLEHIRIARSGLQKYLEKEPGLKYNIITDGKIAFSETEVKPFGVIKYVFVRLPQIGRFALQTARNLSPVESGRYKNSWKLVADGVLVEEVPNNVSELILVNDQPYARKIELRGARRRGVPPGIVEKVRQIVIRRFPQSITANIRYIELKDAYVLKKNYIQIRRSGSRRLHTKAGRELTYPALVMVQKPLF